MWCHFMILNKEKQEVEEDIEILSLNKTPVSLEYVHIDLNQISWPGVEGVWGILYFLDLYKSLIFQG